MEINDLLQAHEKIWSLDGHQILDMEKKNNLYTHARNETPIIQPAANTVSTMQ
jgi:hypothetical protein